MINKIIENILQHKFTKRIMINIMFYLMVNCKRFNDLFEYNKANDLAGSMMITIKKCKNGAVYVNNYDEKLNLFTSLSKIHRYTGDHIKSLMLYMFPKYIESKQNYLKRKMFVDGIDIYIVFENSDIVAQYINFEFERIFYLKDAINIITKHVGDTDTNRRPLLSLLLKDGIYISNGDYIKEDYLDYMVSHKEAYTLLYDLYNKCANEIYDNLKNEQTSNYISEFEKSMNELFEKNDVI